MDVTGHVVDVGQVLVIPAMAVRAVLILVVLVPPERITVTNDRQVCEVVGRRWRRDRPLEGGTVPRVVACFLALLEALAKDEDKEQERSGEDQVTGGRDRQELRQALDDAHHRRLQQPHPVHASPSQQSRA